MPFEAVAELLWTGALPRTRPAEPARVGVPAAHRAFHTRVGTAPARLSLLVPVLALGDAERHGRAARRPSSVRARSLVLRDGWPHSALGRGTGRRRDVEGLPVAQRIARALGGRSDRGRPCRAIDQRAGAVADHELNRRHVRRPRHRLRGRRPVRVRERGAGRSHGRCTAAPRIASRHSSPRSPPGRRRRGSSRSGPPRRPLPGFRHPLYPNGDPRARLLLGPPRVAPRRARSRRGLWRSSTRWSSAAASGPPLDVGLVAIARRSSLPRGSAGALFALGRAAGWIAHALEQREAGYMLRPRARYVGM